MSDIRDILGAGRVEKTEVVLKEKKERAKRPEGMSREAFALLGDQHPIMASHVPATNNGMLKKADLMKPKPALKATPTYQYLAFKNSARTDGLQLKHWIKTVREPNGSLRSDQEDSEYHFAQFDTKVSDYA